MIPAGALVLLDTNVLLHLVRKDAIGQQILSSYQLLDRSERPLLSVVSVGEILTFPKRRDWGIEKTARIDRLLTELVIVPISSRAIAEQYAKIIAFCENQGRTLGDNDGWIAATAATTSSVLLTTDKDFDILAPGLITVERVALGTGAS